MDKEFWIEAYKDKNFPTEPTEFARECLKRQFVVAGQKMLEFGHGNGRDAKFFAWNEVNVTGIDQAGTIYDDDGRLNLIRGDFTNGLQMATMPFAQFNCVYSRFSFHSITEAEQSSALAVAYILLVDGGTLMIECRTIHDELYGRGDQIAPDTFFLDGHRRRFIQPGNLIESLLVSGFSVEYCKLDTGFARHGDEDPPVLRLCVRKETNHLFSIDPASQGGTIKRV